MILADKIILLRKKSGWSQEELAEKLDVSRQSVSKWEGGLSVPDMNKIIGMSTLFGVSTDYLLKDEIEEATLSETRDRDDAHGREVSIEEANRYMEIVATISKRIALGVMLCILSPACLLLLLGVSEQGGNILSETVAVGIGLFTLFLLVGIAVAIFVPNGLRLSEFSYLEKEDFSLGYGVKGLVEKKMLAYTPRFRTYLTVGILLCIFSVVPLLIFSILELDDWLIMASISFILAVCSIGVAIMVRISYINGSYQRLLQIGDFSVEAKKKEKENELLDSAYWSFVVAIYLGISFLTKAWGITWIIWPVAACLFPLLQLLVASIKKGKK